MRIAFPLTSILAVGLIIAHFLDDETSSDTSMPAPTEMTRQVAPSEAAKLETLPLSSENSREQHVAVLPGDQVDLDGVNKELEQQDESLTQNDSKAPYSPEEEINFRFKLDESTHHMIQGSAKADIGDVAFESELLPSNEVLLNINLEQMDMEGVELNAYFDLANFTMELDGKNAVLNEEHKQMLSLAASRLQSKFLAQYEGYGIPEHALMLTQMLSYWAVSPEGFVHEKRSVVSQ